MSIVEDLTGQKFGMLTVLYRVPNEPRRHSRWMCECQCGTQKSIEKAHLPKLQSCGCYRNAIRYTHRASKTPEYHVWQQMRQRCFNPKHKYFSYYGGRGITVCQAWNDSFETFLSDMGTRPSADFTIERVNNDGHYEPSNCRWATRKEQAQNKRPRHYVTTSKSKK